MEHVDLQQLIIRFAAGDCSAADMEQLFQALLTNPALPELAEAMEYVVLVPQVVFTPEQLSEKYADLEKRRIERMMRAGLSAEGDGATSLYVKNNHKPVVD